MATLRDVAVQAGVSLSTVSIIANGRGDERKISEATQQRVRTAMRELGYAPNAAARRLRSGVHRKAIALFWADDYREVMLARFLRGLHRAIGEHGENVDIEVHMYHAGSLSSASSLAGVSGFDALLIANAADADLAFLAAHHPLVPTVLYNRELSGYASVAVDNALVGEKAAHLVIDHAKHSGASKLLLSTGDTTISAKETVVVLCATAPELFAGAAEREQAFCDAIACTGLEVRQLPLAANSAEAGYLALRHEDLTDVRFIFAPGDAPAIGMLRACGEMGLEVPDRLGIVAIGNGLPEYAAFSRPPLTCVEIPMEEMASQCFDLLASVLTQPPASKAESVQIRLDPRIALRGSL